MNVTTLFAFEDELEKIGGVSKGLVEAWHEINAPAYVRSRFAAHDLGREVAKGAVNGRLIEHGRTAADAAKKLLPKSTPKGFRNPNAWK